MKELVETENRVNNEQRGAPVRELEHDMIELIHEFNLYFEDSISYRNGVEQMIETLNKENEKLYKEIEKLKDDFTNITILVNELCVDFLDETDNKQ